MAAEGAIRRVREVGTNTLCWQPSPPLHFPKSSKQRQLVLGCPCPTPVTARLPTTPHRPLPRAHACFKWHPVCVYGWTGFTFQHGTKVGVRCIHGTAVRDLPSPPLLFPLFYSPMLPQATEGRSERQTTVEVSTPSQADLDRRTLQ